MVKLSSAHVASALHNTHRRGDNDLGRGVRVHTCWLNRADHLAASQLFHRARPYRLSSCTSSSWTRRIRGTGMERKEPFYKNFEAKRSYTCNSSCLPHRIAIHSDQSCVAAGSRLLVRAPNQAQSIHYRPINLLQVMMSSRATGIAHISRRS